MISPGKMVPDAAIATLGSAQPGGAAAQVRVRVVLSLCDLLHLIDCFRVSVPPPASFQAFPPGGDAGVAFSTSYRLDGGGDVAGAVQSAVDNGTHMVAVDLSAQRASGVFPAGNYQAQATVRCE